MDVNDDEPEDVKKAASVDKEIRKGIKDDVFEGQPRFEKKRKKWRHCDKDKKNKSLKVAANTNAECCQRKKDEAEAKKLQKITVIRPAASCTFPKLGIVNRDELSRQEYIDILAAPSRKCPPPCFGQAVVERLRPVSDRIKQLAKPTRHRLLMTLQDTASRLPPTILDNLIKNLEGDTCLTPEQAEKTLREKRKKAAYRKDVKGRRKMRKQRAGSTTKKPGLIGSSLFDKESVTCQYLMAERFVKSILEWRCPIPKEEFEDISQVILNRLSYTLEYTPDGDEDRKSQQMRFLADVIACWISGVLLEVTEIRKRSLEEECDRRRQRREEVRMEMEEEMEEDEDREKLESVQMEEEEEEDEEDEEEEEEGEEGKEETGESEGEAEEESKSVEEGESEGIISEGEEKAEEVAETQTGQPMVDEMSATEQVPTVEAETTVAEEEQEGPKMEEKAAEDKAAEDKAAEDKAAEEKAAEEKAAEEKAAEETAAEEKAPEEEPVLEADAKSQELDTQTEETEKGETEIQTEEEEAVDKVDEITGPGEEEKEEEEEQLKETSETLEAIKDLSELFKTDLPFVTIAKIIEAIYKMIESMSDTVLDDPLTDRLTRAVYEKITNLIMAESPELLTEKMKVLLMKVSEKIAAWLRMILRESQIALMHMYPPEVESVEIRGWSKWLIHVIDIAFEWNAWLGRAFDEVERLKDCNVSRGDWQEWTSTIDTGALQWRRFHLQTAHQAHRVSTLMSKRKVVKTGTRDVPPLKPIP